MASYDVAPDLNKIVKQMAEKKGCTAEEAVSYLLTKGIQKWNAEHAYIAKMAKADGAKGKAKAKAKAKAKGPIARKAKASKKEGGSEVAL